MSCDVELNYLRSTCLYNCFGLGLLGRLETLDSKFEVTLKQINAGSSNGMSVPAKHAAQIFPTARAQRWLDREGGQPRKYEGGRFKNISTTAERQWTPNELRRGRKRERILGHFNATHKQLNWKPTKWGSDVGSPREADLERLDLRWDYLLTLKSQLCENWLDTRWCPLKENTADIPENPFDWCKFVRHGVNAHQCPCILL